MPTYAVFSLLAAVFFAFQYVFEKLASKHTIKTRSGLIFYLYLSFLPFTLLLPLFVDIGFPQGIWQIIWLHSLMFFIGNFLFFTAIFKTDVSTFAPIFQVQAGILAILAFVFLKERFPVISYFWIGLMIFGGTLVAYEEKMKLRAFWQKPALLVLASTFFYATSDLFAGFALKHISFWTLTFWAAFTNFVLASAVVVPFPGVSLELALSSLARCWLPAPWGPLLILYYSKPMRPT